MTSKRRHRAIKWAKEGKKQKIGTEVYPFYPYPMKEEKIKLEPHPNAIRLPCLECGKMNHRIKNEYFAIWGTCDMQCYEDMVGVNLYPI